MVKITAKDLLDNYKRAILIDMDRRHIFIINKNAIKVFSHKQYNEVMDKLGVPEIDDA